jgi:N-acyl-L-homoserine lactone synthetase
MKPMIEWFQTSSRRLDQHMITFISHSNLATTAEQLQSFLELRYDIFIRKLGWSIPSAKNGIERDEYDTSGAIYLTISNQSGQVVAGVRLLPTSEPCILNEIFPSLVRGTLPRSPRIFEVTRFAVDQRKERISGCSDLRTSLLWGIQAAALAIGAERLVSVSYMHLEPMLFKAGYSFRRLGEMIDIDGTPTVALEHEVSVDVLNACHGRIRSDEVRKALRLHGCPARHWDVMNTPRPPLVARNIALQLAD